MTGAVAVAGMMVVMAISTVIQAVMVAEAVPVAVVPTVVAGVVAIDDLYAPLSLLLRRLQGR
jgi:hypothetical protein